MLRVNILVAVVLVAASVVVLWVILSVTSSGTFEVVGAG